MNTKIFFPIFADIAYVPRIVTTSPLTPFHLYRASFDGPIDISLGSTDLSRNETRRFNTPKDWTFVQTKLIQDKWISGDASFDALPAQRTSFFANNDTLLVTWRQRLPLVIITNNATTLTITWAIGEQFSDFSITRWQVIPTDTGSTFNMVGGELGSMTFQIMPDHSVALGRVIVLPCFNHFKSPDKTSVAPNIELAFPNSVLKPNIMITGLTETAEISVFEDIGAYKSAFSLIGDQRLAFKTKMK